MKKNLSKVLTLVLAFALVLGLMTVGASAAFTDAADVTYTGAVELLTGLGVINGNPDGSFNPKGNFDRGGLAKMVAYFTWGGYDKSALYANAKVFNDLAGYEWAAGSINYGYNAGYINGVDAKSYDPDGTVTGSMLAKTLLVVLGYKANAKDAAYALTGADWELNSIRLAEQEGLFAGLKAGFDPTKALTREEAAQIFYNLLQKTYTYTLYNTDLTPAAKNTSETVMEKYFTGWTQLDQSFANVDAYGRPAKNFQKAGSTTVLQVVATPVLSYNGTFSAATVAALTEAGYTLPVNGTYNGTETVALSDFYAGAVALNSVTVELFNTDSNPKTIEKAIVIENNFAVVKDIVPTEGKTAGTITLTVDCWQGANRVDFDVEYTDDLTKTNDSYDKLSAYAKGTALVVTLKTPWETDANLLAIAVPTAVAGQITKLDIGTYTTTSTVTVAGTTYPMANSFVDGKVLTLGAQGTLYVDANGNAIGWVGNANPLPNYAYVLDMDSETDNSLFGTGLTVWYAKLLYANGTVETVKTTETSNAKIGNLVVYAAGTGADTGKTVLSGAVADAADGTYTLAANTASQLGGVFNNNTVVVVETTAADGVTKVYTVYTGVTNIPEHSATTYVGTKVPSTDNYSVIFVLGATKTVNPNTTAKDVVYLSTSSTLVKEVISATKTLYYYNVPAVVNGVVTTVKVGAGAAPTYTAKVGAGLYDSLTYDADGLAISGAAKEANVPAKVAMVSETGTAKAANGVVVLGSTNYIYNDATVVYTVAANGAVAASSIGALKADVNDTVVGYTTNGILTMIVVTVNA